MRDSDITSCRQTLSVVIPVYQCAACLEELHTRLKRTLEQLDIGHEIVFVDDRSPDGAWPILERLARDDPATLAIRLSRNFGQHQAITAGLTHCRGDFAVVMDCDLQDPPEAISSLLAEARKGFDIVFARRKAGYDAGWRIAANRLYFRILNWVAGQTYEGEFGSLSLINRKVIDAFCTMKEPDRHFIMLLRWMGFEWSVVDFERQPRPRGRSSYSVAKLISHAFSGVVFTTTKLLEVVVYFGLLMASIGIIAAVAIIVYRVSGGAALPGWASLVVSQLSIGGLIIICIGITALYVGKILDTTRQRPLFIVDQMVGSEEDAEPAGERPEDAPHELPAGAAAVDRGAAGP